MRFELQSIKVKDYIDVTDYVANGSFAALKDNVTYSDTPDFAVLVRLTDHNSGWKNDLVYVDESSYKFLKKSSVQPGDVIISNVGANAGTVFRAPDLGLPMTLGPNSVLLKPKINTPEAKDFLYYFFSSPKGQHNLSSILSGSAQPKFNKTDLRNTEIPVPKGIELSEVTDLLKSLDEKISLNFETNQTLEQMAQTIFKSWFVDFDPVKAKMNGEQPEGMDAVTASLFPEKLVESELGLIPEGWEVGTLDSHTSMIIDHRGKTPKKLGSDWVEEGYPAISAKNIKSKKIVRPDTIRFIDEATYKKWMKEPLIKGDIIMTSEAPMGELYFFDGSEDFCLSQRLYGLRANSDVCSPEFLFNWLQTTKAKADMEGRASGTTALGIKQAELRKVKILTPPRELLEKYSAVASNLVGMAAKNNAQNTVLEDLRDTLLPKLLSGEIDLETTIEN
ncbi:restriction endonuclease subunit S [Vibrio breoganii]|uniref:Restriction endonuclease subunit S n=1 Tax=Vibrio breoganii TaxID=553239 RepID=A0ABX1U2M7_9VIBR|nr:restriction endonuclease subunit S [Vibrio breoganii]NMO72891.1 restriction endonuclease subunit S [Vibrio breoganii]NMR68728.1 restriction endonuclease subunit S [Vibrio breoganii]PML90978.1 hypothetical protein BCT67_03555 [Vibrio breoganii]